MFENRTEAGRRLAAALEDRGTRADVVLAIPRGGLPVARPVADALEAPLDVVAAKKIAAPGNPELAIGAATSEGGVWRNDDLCARLEVSEAHFERERDRAVEAARTKAEQYRPGGKVPEVAGKRLLVVDDGVATGATAIAALRGLRAARPATVSISVPVGPPDALERLEDEADEVVALERPVAFRAVGAHYREFPQVGDEEAVAYLE
ncbi:phosphoribosyltransferase [Saliphagus sp. LR7]|uniref:phosphoribosyltransferase n=1 Tax=Saliphagus sp. LR7 TaxID=2282654 RepID=UPI000DF7733D|nr:phosphoribosyltransferase family protein [Saliphagus sp. LR7]